MLLDVILCAWIAGLGIFLGGLLASIFNYHMKDTPVKHSIIHILMSFGAGIILSAVSLILVPYGMRELGIIPIIVSFLLGAFIFMWIDRKLSKKGGKVATLLAMLMDFIPETLVLGALFSTDPKIAVLLAVFITLQNIPEAFNSYRDLVNSGVSVKKTLILFFSFSFLGILAVFLGYAFLSSYPVFTAEIMMFASGGILYLLIQDIIPDSKVGKHYLISMGAIVGFLIGIVSHKLI